MALCSLRGRLRPALFLIFCVASSLEPINTIRNELSKFNWEIIVDGFGKGAKRLREYPDQGETFEWNLNYPTMRVLLKTSKWITTWVCYWVFFPARDQYDAKDDFRWPLCWILVLYWNSSDIKTVLCFHNSSNVLIHFNSKDHENVSTPDCMFRKAIHQRIRVYYRKSEPSKPHPSRLMNDRQGLRFYTGN